MDSDRQARAGLEYLRQLKESNRGFRSERFLPERLPDFGASDSRIEVLAYYLPQFHPFKENDEWWGRGFTEWTNVTKARAHFPGHNQPHLPADVGFYDLRNEETIGQQVRLAKSYGLTGFIFYFYWFDGRRVLERPLDLFLARKDFDFGFSLCWANENWTRRWDGAEHEVLLGQTHSPESDERFISDVLHYMEDPRYTEIDGRPLLTVYRVGLLPELQRTSERWRKIAKERLGKDLFLVYAMTFGETRDPKTFGFDAAIQFPPHGVPVSQVNDRIQPFSETYAGSIYDYEALASASRDHLKQFQFPVIPAVFPSWDNTPRRGENAHLYIGSSPDTYAAWLAEAAHHAASKPVEGRSIVVVNAWNEWAEGAHLEPDQTNGHAFLRVTSDIMLPYLKRVKTDVERPLQPTASVPSPNARSESRTAIIIHAFHAQSLERILSSLNDVDQSDLFITLPVEPAEPVLRVIAKWAWGANLLFFPNRGRDIRPFLGAINEVATRDYRYFIKLHTKLSSHRSDGEIWGEELIQPFVRNGARRDIEWHLASKPEVGMVGPAGHVLDGKQFMGSAHNVAWLTQLARRMGWSLEISDFKFIAGSMFAGRVEDFITFSSDGWISDMFEEEVGRRDGTLAHAMERMFGLCCYRSGRNISEISAGGGIESILSAPSVYGFAQAQSWK